MPECAFTTMPKSWTQLKDRSGAIPPRKVKPDPGIAYARAWAKDNGEIGMGIGDQELGNVSIVASLTLAAATELQAQLGAAIKKASDKPREDA